MKTPLFAVAVGVAAAAFATLPVCSAATASDAPAPGAPAEARFIAPTGNPETAAEHDARMKWWR